MGTAPAPRNEAAGFGWTELARCSRERSLRGAAVSGAGIVPAQRQGHTSTLAGREDWKPLPRRRPPRRVPEVLAIRTPIPKAWRWALVVLSLAIPLLLWTLLSA